MNKKSLKGIDIYLQGKEDLISNMETEIKSYPNNGSIGIANAFVKSLKTDVEFLKELKTQLTSK